MKKLVLCVMVLGTLMFSLTLFGENSSGSANISYKMLNPYHLIFVNNPEKILNDDLADVSGKIIYEQSIQSGKYWDFFEHQNCTNSTLGYAVEIKNPNSHSAHITLLGEGFVASAEGAKPFVQLQNALPGTKQVRLTLAPHQTYVIFRKDNTSGSDNIFCGVIAFSVHSQNPLIIQNLAYHDFKSINPNAVYEGYITRVVGTTNDSRLYKGELSASVVKLTGAKFSIDDSMSPGTILPVSYKSYYESGSSFIQSGSSTVFTQGWVSNITPNKVPSAICTDMVSIDTPQYGVIYPLVKSDASAVGYPNIGNWGVVYSISASIKNRGTAPHSVSFVLSGGQEWASSIAYTNQNIREWRDAQITNTSPLTVVTEKIPPHTTKILSCRFILGGSSGGKLLNQFIVDN